jgi:hypothetical protein
MNRPAILPSVPDAPSDVPASRIPAPRRAAPRGPLRARRTPRGTADGAVAVLLTLVAVWRWSLVAAVPGPIGVDTGNWLRLANALLGRVDVQDVVVPPLVPILAGTLDALVGPLATARALPVLASLAPALGLWWVVRRLRYDATAVAVTVAVALVPPTAAAFAWGGVPQLLGLGLLPIALAALAAATETRGRAAWLRAGVLVALVGLTSTLVSVLLAVGGAALMTVALLRDGRAPLTGVSASLAPVAPVAVLYAVILPRMSLPEGRLTAATGLDALRHGLGEPSSVWAALITAVGVAILLAVATGTATRTVLLLVGLLASAVAGLLLGDVRFVAGLPTAVAAGVALLPTLLGRDDATYSMRTDDRSNGARALRFLGVAGLVLIASVGVRTQATQIGFYAQFAPPNIIADAERIAVLVPSGQKVAVPPVAGAPTGWWLQAHGVDAAVASRSDWLSFPAERAAAAEALALFTATGWPDAGAAVRACELGAPWLYIPDAWGGMDPDALARELPEGRLRVVERLSGGLLLRSAAC